MKFGPVPIDDALGAVLAHSLVSNGKKLKKGVRLGDDHIEALRAGGIETVIVAAIEPATDVTENDAAAAIAAALISDGLRAEDAFTGRANLIAEKSGLVRFDKAVIDAVNRIDPAITLATLADFEAVDAGRMIATVKIIPYAVSRAVLNGVLTAIGAGGAAMTLHPFRPLKVGVVSTTLPGMKPKVIDKTLAVLADRLAPADAEIIADRRIAHDAGAVADALAALRTAGAELLILFGASAVADRNDVIPAAIETAGGSIIHFGMPVDPGNLLLLADLGNTPVIGAPGCARSPRENGFDWVLNRLLAGLPVAGSDITAMGVGGLLKEITSRPQPRAGPRTATLPARPNVAAIVLAAGRSSRMGGPNKLLATIDGVPLVRRVVDAAEASKSSSVTLVTGHRAEQVASLFEKDEIQIIHNDDYEKGLSSSLATGIAAVPDDAVAAIILLGDMPMVSPQSIDRLIDAFDPEAGIHIVVPTFNGKRGNPVLWSRQFFSELRTISGDVGARHLVGRYADAVAEVEIGLEVALDLDTPEALAAAGGELPGEA